MFEPPAVDACLVSYKGTSPRRSRIWWYRRMRKAYRLHGVTIRNRRQTWEDAMFARRMMEPMEQWLLGPLRGPDA